MIKLDKAKEIANSVPGVVSFFRPLYRKTLKVLFEGRKRRIFLASGLSVLNDFHKLLTENDYYYTLAFGTLLGAIREKGFIKHDIDIDVNMWAEDYSSSFRDLLEANGFKLDHGYLVDDGIVGREESYKKNGVSIDIFFIFKDETGKPYCCDFLLPEGCISYSEAMHKCGGTIVRKLYLPFEKKRLLSSFENVQLFVPENSHDILVARYGDTYMIPNPNWGIRSYDNSIVVWEGKKGKRFQ